jgi:NAD(P)-dependent dehydrogenase (short-subunit alcohol dehydrogenase family)
MTGSALIQGASRGIGLGLVQALLARDTDSQVIATCRNPERADRLSELERDHPGRLQIFRLDVQEEGSIAEAARRLIEEGVELDLLVNVAGLLHDGAMQPEKKLADLDPDHFRRAFEVNATGPLLVAKHFHPLLRHERRAVFASLSARVGSIADNRRGGWYAYRASKAAQNMGTKTLALELQRIAPRVLCVGLHPGTVETDLSLPFRRHVPDSGLFTVERAAQQLLSVIAGLTPDQTGSVLAWDGTVVPC